MPFIKKLFILFIIRILQVVTGVTKVTEYRCGVHEKITSVSLRVIEYNKNNSTDTPQKQVTVQVSSQKQTLD